MTLDVGRAIKNILGDIVLVLALVLLWLWTKLGILLLIGLAIVDCVLLIEAVRSFKRGNIASGILLFLTFLFFMFMTFITVKLALFF